MLCSSSLPATVARDAPIIPISAQLKYNIDAVNEYICTKIPVPKHDFEADPRLIVIRSFDVNKPGSTVDELKGGVAGGSILSGVFKVCFNSGRLVSRSQVHKLNRTARPL